MIENVEDAKGELRSPLMLCWTHFYPAGWVTDVDFTPLWMRRHRLFESSVDLWPADECVHPRDMQCAGAYDGARRDKVEARTIRHGGYVPGVEVMGALLGIDWMSEKGLQLSIPQPCLHRAHRLNARPGRGGMSNRDSISYDRAPTHGKPAVPLASDVAARLQAGETLADIAAQCGRTVGTIRQDLLDRGYDSATALPLPPVRVAVRNVARVWAYPEWSDRALCAQSDPEEFFPDNGQSVAKAKAVCRACPVETACLAYALEHDLRFGVWGACTPRERQAIKRGVA